MVAYVARVSARGYPYYIQIRLTLCFVVYGRGIPLRIPWTPLATDFTDYPFQEDTMSHSLLDLAYQLTQSGEPFVIATVVWCERPTSAKPGAQAIIQENGQITGWIGGSCAQPVVLREAARVLREGSEPFLLRLGSSDTGIVHDNVRVFPMTCASGGVLDIYMEPHLIPPQLLLIGD